VLVKFHDLNGVLVAEVFLPEAGEIVEFVTGNGFQGELSVVEGPLVSSVWVPLVVSNESLPVLAGVPDVMTSVEDKGGATVSEGPEVSEKAVNPEVVFDQITELEITPLEIREAPVPMDIDVTDGVVVRIDSDDPWPVMVELLAGKVGMPVDTEEPGPVVKLVVQLLVHRDLSVIVEINMLDMEPLVGVKVVALDMGNLGVLVPGAGVGNPAEKVEFRG
jgi:hypothetical protein